MLQSPEPKNFYTIYVKEVNILQSQIEFIGKDTYVSKGNFKKALTMLWERSPELRAKFFHPYTIKHSSSVILRLRQGENFSDAVEVEQFIKNLIKKYFNHTNKRNGKILSPKNDDLEIEGIANSSPSSSVDLGGSPTVLPHTQAKMTFEKVEKLLSSDDSPSEIDVEALLHDDGFDNFIRSLELFLSEKETTPSTPSAASHKRKLANI